MNAFTHLKMTSNSEMLLCHEKADRIIYQKMRGVERQNLKDILKHRSAWKYRQEMVNQVDPEMWNKGHPQNLTCLNALHKIRSEINEENTLELKSTDLQDIFQYWLKQNELKDSFIKVTTLPLRIIMFTRKQVELLLADRGLKIDHLDSTSSIASKPYNCKGIDYYCIGRKCNNFVILAVEMLTLQHNILSISMLLKEYKFFVIQEFNTWPVFQAIVLD